MAETLPHASSHDVNTDLIWQRFQVPFEYPVFFGRGLFERGSDIVRRAVSLREPDKRHRCIFFVDDGVLRSQPELLKKIQSYADANADMIELACAPVPVPGGETIKNDPAHMTAISNVIAESGLDRHSYVIAVGGGAVLDTVGYAAAIAHRGIRHIRIPTTVLSQNDSGVGVKNAVNAFGKKNYSGTFAPPWAVINDLDFLNGLPRQERLAGISEAIKVSLIRDGAFFLWLEQNAGRLANFEPDAEEYMVRHCAQLHMNQIALGGDPFELGSSRPLDFGHWSAHKLEALTGHSLSHGNAVSIGIALDARYSVLAGLMPDGEDHRVLSLLKKLGLPIWHSTFDQKDNDGRLSVIAGLEEFQEHLGGELTITLLASCGTGVDVHAISSEYVLEAIEWLRTQDQTS